MKSDGKPHEIPVPSGVFEELVPRVHDLGELKLLLHVVQIGAQRGSTSVPFGDLLAPDVMRSIVGKGSPVPGPDRLRAVVDRAVANDILLRLTLQGVDGQEMYFLPATTSNRDALARMNQERDATQELGLPLGLEATLYRPNVFSLYERHIGPLSPLVAEQLRDAERSYPRSWIEAAIGEAVNYNKRNWRYIESILVRWEADGAPDGAVHRTS